MGNTFTQVHLHIIFAVQNRTSLIDKSWEERLYKYIIAIIQNRGHKVLAIGGMPDHIHILIGFRPTEAPSLLIQIVKRDTSLWINENKLVRGSFNWQEGYGVFSYSKSQLSTVISYIENQKKHHSKQSFQEEFKSILDRLGIDYDPQYLFHKVE
jgi:putative transposase